MSVDAQQAIQALIRAEALAERRKSPPGQPPCVIALSRQLGTGGLALAERLSERLGLAVYDRNLLNRIANGVDVEPYLLESLDERVCALRSNWIERLLTRKCELAQAYRRNLINAILQVSRSGGIVVGRGSTFVLAGCRHCLRVRLIGSPGQRAEAYAQQQGIEVEEARERIARVDAERAAFVQELTGYRADDCNAYDLIINTDELDEDTRLELIVTALRSKPCQLARQEETDKMGAS